MKAYITLPADKMVLESHFISTTVFENKDKMVLVMEIAAGGELYDYLSERKCLEDTEARRIFRQVATATFYCHKNNICHRDLKLENILLDEKGSAKVRQTIEKAERVRESCESSLFYS